MATVVSSRPTLSIPATPFRNEPFTDFTRPENARQMREALAHVRSELGREYDIVIGNRMIKTKEKSTSLNPARPEQVVGVFQHAEAEHVAPAIQAATEAFEKWKRTSVEERVSLLMNVAAILRDRKFEFCAWLV
ncbi:MAG TPA: aldehyde dehydrogenase family protein, partial [Candidatus Angelobacter sp.]|nr:aldehyde dehydrogenase family protein [Candidatus Angelobacter sp.]